MKRICVFCGSSFGRRPEYRQAARALGEILAREQIGLVYGGASVGLMGEVADAVLAQGGEAIGVIPRHLASKEIAHTRLSELKVVESMHERKAMMAELADGFIALPGGLGTFEEFCEILTWSQLGLHEKPIGLLNVAAYYQPLLNLAERGENEGFIRPHHREMILVAEEPAELLAKLQAYRPVKQAKWIKDLSQT